MEVTETRRIVLLGKTGYGKSSLANTIFGENDVFKINHISNSETKQCQAETRSVNRRSISLIDTPGLFDTDMSEENLRTEIVRCITECAPGPHAFLIVLQVGKFTEQEKAVIRKICEYFSEEAFKYAAVVFTHGDQLKEGMTIEEFVQQNQGLSDLVRKCGGRCHVIDNKYWNNRPNEYRSNQFQVAELLNTIDNIVMENNGGYYTNEMLKRVEEEIQQEQENREQAKVNVLKKLLIRLAGTATGILLGALLGVPGMIFVVVTTLTTMQPAAAAAAAAAEVTVGAAGVAVTTGLVVGGFAAAGAAVGGFIGYRKADQADSVGEAVENTAKSIWDIIRQHFKKLQINKKQRQSEEKGPLL